MNDHDLDRLVATAAPVDDGWVATLDLRDAERELMEEIVSTPRTPAADAPAGPPAAPSGAPGPRPGEASPFRAAPRRSRVAVRAALAAAVVIAALVIGALVTRGGGARDDRARWAAGGSAAVPAMAEPVPDGFELDMVSGGDRAAPAPPRPPNTWVYGDLTDRAVANDVVVKVEPQPPDYDIVSDTLSEPVIVRGTRGALCSPGRHPCDFGNNITGVSWIEPSGTYVSVESQTYDANEVLAISEGLAVDGDRVTLGAMPGGVPAPPLLAELDDLWRWAHTVGYRAAKGRSFTVSTRAQTEAMRIYDLWRSGPRDDAQVNGHDAAVDDLDGAYTVTWAPVPGQLVEVLSNQMDEAATLDVAEAVRPATPAEWADLERQAASAPTTEPPGLGIEEPPEGAARRLLADGTTEVWGWLGAGGGPCYQVAEDGAERERLCTGDSSTTVVGVSPSSSNNGPTIITPAASGIAPEGTATIDGADVTFGPEAPGGRSFVCEFRDGVTPATVTFRGADGADLGTAEVVVT